MKPVYVIHLSNESGQQGYFGVHNAVEGGFMVFADACEAEKFATEEDAEQFLLELEERYGLDREDARIEMIVEDERFSLKLGDAKYADGLTVEAPGDRGDRLLTVHVAGMEYSADLPDEVGRALITLLGKLRRHLRSGGRK